VKIARRKFLGAAGLGLGAAGLTAFTSKGSENRMPLSEIPFGGAGLPQQEEELDWQAIDESHKSQVDKFLANIGSDPDFWLPDLEPVIAADGAKEFTITCADQEWETEPGVVYPAFTINGRVPGPTIRVTEGDLVRVKVINNMSESTGIHFHGVHVPYTLDGVPYVTQEPIVPGSEYTYEMTIREGNAGSHMYHSHHNAAEQVVRGLLGAFIIEPADKSNEPAVDAEYIMILNDSGLGYTINGKSFPATQPMVAKLGQRLRIRYMNEGLMIHPMHLHGLPQIVTHKDGYALPAPFKGDTILVSPGERFDVLVDCFEAGLWSFHCHVLTHAESRRGLHGMTTVLVVEE
jgi:FtsP/CotA-like multicopper oxidase with cupredoxin domain